MNIDRDLVARALAKAGEEPITAEEWEEGTSNRVRIVKEFYHAILLESLSSYDWTSQKKRARLEVMDNYEYEEVLNPKAADVNRYYEYVYDQYHQKYYYRKAETFSSGTTYFIRIDNNLTGYAYMYILPADCAKVVKLANDEPYVVEGAFLFADVADAVLVYIRNYFTGKYIYEKVEEPDPVDIDKYYVIEDGEYVKAESYIMGTDYYVIKEEDYNFYAEPELDPSLSAYFECKLAANLALKLTGGADKYQMLYNEAELIANKAQKKSSEQAQNKTKGNAWWTDQLGLTSGGEIHAYN
jgi:hypothetical protein